MHHWAKYTVTDSICTFSSFFLLQTEFWHKNKQKTKAQKYKTATSWLSHTLMQIKLSLITLRRKSAANTQFFTDYRLSWIKNIKRQNLNITALVTEYNTDKDFFSLFLNVSLFFPSDKSERGLVLTNRQPPIKQSHKDSIHFYDWIVSIRSLPRPLCCQLQVIKRRRGCSSGQTVRVIRQGTTGGTSLTRPGGGPGLCSLRKRRVRSRQGEGGKENEVWLLGEINIVNYYLAFIARLLTSYMQLQIFYMKLLSVFGFLCFI